ncbi:MAG: glycosyltransferase family 4 protein [Desulfovibrionaceae bacterium]|nr:glycosyltransferase family 4 protein [Desulfovibrionaceae bacterium]
MAQPKRVLFCMEDLCFGGTQRQTLELVKRLDRSRFSPSMLMLTGPTDLDDLANKANISLYYLNNNRKVHPAFFLKLGPMIHKLNPDLLIPCTALPNIWVRILGKLLKIPVIGTCRGGGSPKRQHERFLWRLTSKLICNSKALAQVLNNIGVPLSHITYIPNGVDTEYFKPSGLKPSERQPLILCVARLCADKDHLTLFKALAQIRPEFPEAKLLLVGDGPLESELKAWATAHPDLPISFASGTTDVRPYYHKARIFALSSNKEGQPNVLLEAMSSGLPVCATNVGGIPNLVQDGSTGFLAPKEDSESLAQKLKLLLSQPDLGDQFGQRGRIWVEEHFSFTAMVEAHEQLFLKVLQK